MTAMKRAFDAFTAERLRQVKSKGFSGNHDDKYTQGELAKAAACYAMGTDKIGISVGHSFWTRILWPWGSAWWKPSKDNRKRDIEKAVALLCAEWERLDRMGVKK